MQSLASSYTVKLTIVNGINRAVIGRKPWKRAAVPFLVLDSFISASTAFMYLGKRPPAHCTCKPPCGTTSNLAAIAFSSCPMAFSIDSHSSRHISCLRVEQACKPSVQGTCKMLQFDLVRGSLLCCAKDWGATLSLEPYLNLAPNSVKWQSNRRCEPGGTQTTTKSIEPCQLPFFVISLCQLDQLCKDRELHER